MDLRTFTDNFGLLVSGPNGIPKLREMILQLAVMGKLVPQDPRDEPASVLLERIAEEKERFIAEGKIKKSKPLPPIKPEGAPFDLPKGWEWVRFGAMFDIQGGTQPPKSTFIYEPQEGYIRLLQIRDFGKRPLPTYVPINTVRRFCESDDILIGRYGASVGKILTGHKGAYNVAMAKLVFPKQCVSSQFIFVLLNSNVFQLHLLNASRSAQAGFNKGDIFPIVLPLPPLAEQKRIVAKVAALMALCNELEEKKKTREHVSVSMNTACLHELTSPEPAMSQKGWARIRDNFDLLYDTPENVAALRQSILQLAVMGKLVPQDPNDEPASVLLEKIAAEKERLIAEGKIKKSKPLPPIDPDEVPYELPEGWEWVRLGTVVDHRLGKMLDKNKNRGPLHSYLRNANVRWFDFDLSHLLKIRVETSELEEVSLRRGDLVVCEGGEPGRTAIWDKEESIVIQKALHRVRPLDGLYNKYLAYVMRADADSGRLTERFTGATIKHLTGKSLAAHLVPIAPTNEQYRIVEKVAELLGLCNELESRLKQSHTASEKLMEAVVNRMTEREKE